MSLSDNTLALATSNGSMYIFSDPDSKVIIFASERIILENAIETLSKDFRKKLSIDLMIELKLDQQTD